MFYAYICETSILVVETRYFTKPNISHYINREWPLWWVCEGSHWRKLVGFLHRIFTYQATLRAAKSQTCLQKYVESRNPHFLFGFSPSTFISHPPKWGVMISYPDGQAISKGLQSIHIHENAAWLFIVCNPCANLGDIEILKIEKQESLPSKMALPHITTSHLSHSKYVSPVDRIENRI